MSDSNVKTICELWGQSKRTDGVGIEVEVEATKPLPSEIGGVWLSHTDGSLRGHAMEYVCRQPLKIGPDTLKHIKNLTDKLADPTLGVNMSARTSVHIHRNVQHFTPVQVWNAIIAYWLLEDPLLNYCGDERKGSHFCLPLSCCDGIIETCTADLESRSTPFSKFSVGGTKYGGQNLSTISRYGSIEYRSMRGTIDPEIIHTWAATLYNLTEAAKNFKDPADLLDFYFDKDLDTFLAHFLSPAFIKIVKDTPGFKKCLGDNALRLVEIAYATDDWAKWQESRSLQEAKIKKTRESLLATQGTSSLPTIGAIELGTTSTNDVTNSFTVDTWSIQE